MAENELLTDLLESVSRTFYRTLHMLPPSIRPQIGLAYLLARATDTIADTELVPVERRLECLRQLRRRIQGDSKAPLDFGELAGRQESGAERTLLLKTEASLALLDALLPPDRQRIRETLDIITSGQELDLRRFGAPAPGKIVALQADEELEDYTYRVAGCVGEFWTRMCRAHVFPKARLNDAFLLEHGVRFGKGLQLVNILRDLPADLRRGRCYFPAQKLAAAGLKPEDLLLPRNGTAFQPHYSLYLDRAHAYLAAGWAYTNALPWRHARVRLACAWPILIGVQTLRRLRVAPVLDPNLRVKVSRRKVKQIIFCSTCLYPFPPAWRRLFTARAAA